MRWNKKTGILLVVLAAVGLVITKWPLSVQTAQIPFSSTDELEGTISLSYSDHLKIGDKSEVSLNITFDQSKNVKPSIILYSKLELNNLEVSPFGEGKVTVDPSKPLVLKWDVLPWKSGAYSGTLWLFSESTEGDKQLILARPINLVAKTFIGLSYHSVRISCIFGLIAGLFLFFFPLINIKKPRSSYNLI